MPEETRTCAYCGKVQVWQWTGERLKDGSKIHVDDRGQRWAGKRCAECEKKRVQTALRFNRFDRTLIAKDLSTRGYRIKKFANPIVAEHKGKIFNIPIRKAYINDNIITVEDPLNNTNTDPCLLVFSSTRMFTPEQLADMTNRGVLAR